MKIEDTKELAYWSIMNAYYWRHSQDAIKLIDSTLEISKLFENGFIRSEKYSNISKKMKSFLLGYVGKSIDIYERDIAALKADDVTLIPYKDERYPTLLKTVPNPPLMLYHKGFLMDFNKCIAVVGRRRLSSFGHIQVREISKKLATEGYTVVSGLARGVDTEAHVGALQGEGKTIAILPTNFSKIYPEENDNLLLDIMVKGAAITMTPPRTELEKSRFVHRNRIISGISRAVIIAETDGMGGSARQIEFAQKQNKPIYIMRPKGNAEAVEGFEKFVKEGLIQFRNSDELIELLSKNKLKTLYQKKIS